MKTWFVNVGMDNPNDPCTKAAHPYVRHWQLCRRYGYLSAGGGPQYSNPLYRLGVGDEVFAYQARAGYVGYGIVTNEAQPTDDLRVENGRRLPDVLSDLAINLPDSDSDEWEHAVAIDWKDTRSMDEAIYVSGMFAGRLTACELRHEATLERLRQHFAT